MRAVLIDSRLGIFFPDRLNGKGQRSAALVSSERKAVCVCLSAFMCAHFCAHVQSTFVGLYVKTVFCQICSQVKLSHIHSYLCETVLKQHIQNSHAFFLTFSTSVSSIF